MVGKPWTSPVVSWRYLARTDAWQHARHSPSAASPASTCWSLPSPWWVVGVHHGWPFPDGQPFIDHSDIPIRASANLCPARPDSVWLVVRADSTWLDPVLPYSARPAGLARSAPTSSRSARSAPPGLTLPATLARRDPTRPVLPLGLSWPCSSGTWPPPGFCSSGRPGTAEFGIRDPADPLRMLPAYDTGDHLHPSDAATRRLPTPSGCPSSDLCQCER